MRASLAIAVALVAVASGTAAAELPVIAADRGAKTPLLEARAQVSGGDALLRARGVFGPPALADAAKNARLAVLVHPAAPTPRLVWEVVYADEAGRATYRALVDANSGEVLYRENLVARSARHRARVFAVNPIVSDAEEVVFADISEASDVLSDDELTVVNCIDRRSCREVKTLAGVRNIHYCDTVPTVFADADRGFLDVAIAGDTDPEDGFAEVQAYHHVKTALDAFRVFAGDPSFALRRPLLTVVNHRLPDLGSTTSRCSGATARDDSELVVEDNAYFWPAGDIGPTDLGDRILLAQGAFADWAYDGEVVYHEVTHAVMHTTTPLAWFRHDDLGVDFLPGALHEGFSDYFASAMTGNSKPNVYAGMTEDGPAPLGDLEALRRCGDSLVGEEHEDSLAWSNALWMIRRSLRSAAKRGEFDAAMFRVISRLGRFDSFAEASALVMDELENGTAVLRDVAAAAREKLVDRQLFDCMHRTAKIRPGEVKAELYAKGPNSFGIDAFASQAMPAGMQFSLETSAKTTAIRLRAAASFALTEEILASTMKRVPKLAILVKRGAEPIRWTWQLPRGESDADFEVAMERVDPDDETAGYVATFDGEFEAGQYQVQIVNRGADVGLEELHFSIANADGEFDADKTDDLGGQGQGCGVGERAGSPIAAFLIIALLFLALGARRRQVPVAVPNGKLFPTRMGRHSQVPPRRPGNTDS